MVYVKLYWSFVKLVIYTTHILYRPIRQMTLLETIAKNKIS